MIKTSLVTYNKKLTGGVPVSFSKEMEEILIWYELRSLY